jgi:hypothetical protein
MFSEQTAAPFLGLNLPRVGVFFVMGIVSETLLLFFVPRFGHRQDNLWTYAYLKEKL